MVVVTEASKFQIEFNDVVVYPKLSSSICLYLSLYNNLSFARLWVTTDYPTVISSITDAAVENIKVHR
jgi:hypothetical protein